MIRFNRVVRLAIAAAVALDTSAAWASDTELSAYLDRYRCPIVERLKWIHATLPRAKDRYLILGVRQAPQAYVQCLFLDNDTRVLCEASSGFYATLAGETRLYRPSPTARAALKKLGFSMDDSDGNYQRMLVICGDGDLKTVADLMLSALYVGYAVREPSVTVEADAPLARELGNEISACAYVS